MKETVDKPQSGGANAVGNPSANLKKSAADVLDGYYKRMYDKYKEMYENGNVAR